MAMSAKTYICNVVKKFEAILGPLWEFKSPMDLNYHPELDTTPLMDEKHASLYHALISSANWLITIRHFDINYATNAMSRFAMAPREGHLAVMKRVFGYLKKYHKGRIIVDPSWMDWTPYKTEEDHTWKEMNPNAEEEIPSNMPEPMGKVACITCFVDADHAHDKITRRSVTGIILFINNTPIKWISKRQQTVKTSTYGSKMVTARIACELILEVRYCLRMMGVPVDGPALMLGDNLSVIVSTMVPSSMLKKKHQAICYHHIRECVAANVVRFVHVVSKDNLSDCMTMPLANDTFLGHIWKMLFRHPEGKDQQQRTA